MATDNTLENRVDQLKKELSSLIDQNKKMELQTQKRLNELFDRVDDIDSWSNFINSLDDIPGVRQPKWYKIEVPFEYGEKQEQSGQVQISASGPFVCTQMQSYFRITDTDPEHYSDYYGGVQGTPAWWGGGNPPRPDPTLAKSNTAVGRAISPTSYWGVPNRSWEDLYLLRGSQLPIGYLFSNNVNISGVDYWFEGWNSPEFDVRIQTVNNNSYWTGLSNIPSAAFYGIDSPLYLATPSIVQASDNIAVFAKPSTPSVQLAGVYTLVLHGYHIGLHTELENLGV